MESVNATGTLGQHRWMMSWLVLDLTVESVVALLVRRYEASLIHEGQLYVRK